MHRRGISEQRQLSTGEKPCGDARPQVSGVQSFTFACIKLEPNTNQHEMQRAEVFLSHTYTHTYTHTHRVEQGNTHLIGRTLEILS